jgi:hypothetical protein
LCEVDVDWSSSLIGQCEIPVLGHDLGIRRPVLVKLEREVNGLKEGIEELKLTHGDLCHDPNCRYAPGRASPGRLGLVYASERRQARFQVEQLKEAKGKLADHVGSLLVDCY